MMVQVQKITTFAFLLFIVGIFTTTQTHAQQTHIVDLAGTGDYESIHAAVEAASSGDTIRVQPDQYAFTESLGAIEIDKRLVILGSGYMPVEEGGTELIDIAGNGFFDLTGSADGTVIRGFRVQGATDFLDTESGTANVTVEENLFIEGTEVLHVTGTADTVRSNIFYQTGRAAIRTAGSSTSITHNIITEAVLAGSYYHGHVEVTGSGSEVVVAYNLFLNGTTTTSYYRGAIVISAGSPEVYSNGFINNENAIALQSSPSPFITNNGYYNSGGEKGLNPVDEAPSFESFDVDNEVLDLEAIDEGDYDLTLTDGSEWIDAGRTGTLYLDADGSRSDIGIYAGKRPFKDGMGAPTVPVVIDFQVSPVTVSPTGTIKITATGRIGSGSN